MISKNNRIEYLRKYGMESEEEYVKERRRKRIHERRPKRLAGYRITAPYIKAN
jgi:hypothetical protein